MNTPGGVLGTPRALLVVEASIVIEWHRVKTHTAALRLPGDDIVIGSGPLNEDRVASVDLSRFAAKLNQAGCGVAIDARQ